MRHKDDDLDVWLDSFAEWMDLADSEQERLCRLATDRHRDMRSRMTQAEEITYTCARVLSTCRRYRRLLNQHDIVIFRKNLRDAQISLVQLREWRRTALRPGNS